MLRRQLVLQLVSTWLFNLYVWFILSISLQKGSPRVLWSPMLWIDFVNLPLMRTARPRQLRPSGYQRNSVYILIPKLERLWMKRKWLCRLMRQVSTQNQIVTCLLFLISIQIQIQISVRRYPMKRCVFFSLHFAYLLSLTIDCWSIVAHDRSWEEGKEDMPSRWCGQ